MQKGKLYEPKHFFLTDNIQLNNYNQQTDLFKFKSERSCRQMPENYLYIDHLLV